MIGTEDLEGVVFPRNDTLVIRMAIANYEIARVLIDSESSVNVLFRRSFDQMCLGEANLYSVSTTLFGFAGHMGQPMGQIVLPLSLGKEPLRKTHISSFTIVGVPTCDVILGWLALVAFMAMTSLYHQKIKFLVENQVGILRGSQQVTRGCYVKMVQVDQKKTHEGIMLELELKLRKDRGIPVFISCKKQDQGNF